MSRKTTPRLWRTLAIAGAAAGVAAGAHADPLADYAKAGEAKLWLAQSEGGEGGEGGEAGTALGDAKVDFLTDLGLIEGHLRAGIELYRSGEQDMAATHMKHPGDEIYTELAQHLENYDLPGFADELSLLSATVEGGASVEEADAAFATVIAKLVEARAVSVASARDRIEALEHMVLVAAEEYEIGVNDGIIVEMHEYQDAWGFVQASRAEAEMLAGSSDAMVRKAGEAVLKALSDADSAFAGIVPKGDLSSDASALHGAAARIEIAGLKLK